MDITHHGRRYTCVAQRGDSQVEGGRRPARDTQLRSPHKGNGIGAVFTAAERDHYLEVSDALNPPRRHDQTLDQ